MDYKKKKIFKILFVGFKFLFFSYVCYVVFCYNYCNNNDD